MEKEFLSQNFCVCVCVSEFWSQNFGPRILCVCVCVSEFVCVCVWSQNFGPRILCLEKNFCLITGILCLKKEFLVLLYVTGILCLEKEFLSQNFVCVCLRIFGFLEKELIL